MNHSPLSALVIATSSGVPMRSERPKPIHLLCGRPMLRYVLDVVERVGAQHVTVVTGREGSRVSKRILDDPPLVPLTWVEQLQQRGSADAAQLALSGFDDFDDDADVLVVPADLPLLRANTLRQLVSRHRSSGAACTVLSAAPGLAASASSSVGEIIVRNRHGAAVEVRPWPDVVDSDHEVALGVYCVRRSLLAPAARRAFHLSGIVEVLAASGHTVDVAPLVAEIDDVRPVDDRRLLAEAERELRRRINLRWLGQGVTMVDPDRTYVDVTVELGTDVTLFPGTILQGATTIADGCEIGPDTRLDRCKVGARSVVEKAMARDASIGNDCRVGPFAVLEPGANLPDGTETGPFYAAKAGE